MRAPQTFIEPDLKTAHLQIHNFFNPFSGLMNPIYILKSAQRVTKQQIKAVLKVTFCVRDASLPTAALGRLAAASAGAATSFSRYCGHSCADQSKCTEEQHISSLNASQTRTSSTPGFVLHSATRARRRL